MQFVRRFAEGGNTATPAPNNAFQQAAEKVSAIYTPQAASTGSPFAAASNQVANTLGVSANMFPQAPAPQNSGLGALQNTATTAAPQQSGIGTLATEPTPVMQQGLGALNTPTYSRHEGMLFGDDFYDRYAQNVGGQFKDPYHNFLVTRGVGSPNGPKIEDLYKQYQASGRTDTPDWATAQIKPVSTIPRLSQSWDASGATPVDSVTHAWAPSTPLAEGVTVPEGYWDARLAYNMNLSKGHPDLYKPEDYTSGRVREINDPAYYALSQSIYDINDPRIAQYMNQRATSGMGDRPIW